MHILGGADGGGGGMYAPPAEACLAPGAAHGFPPTPAGVAGVPRRCSTAGALYTSGAYSPGFNVRKAEGSCIRFLRAWSSSLIMSIYVQAFLAESPAF